MGTYQDTKKAETRMSAGLRPGQWVKVRSRQANYGWAYDWATSTAGVPSADLARTRGAGKTR